MLKSPAIDYDFKNSGNYFFVKEGPPFSCTFVRQTVLNPASKPHRKHEVRLHLLRQVWERRAQSRLPFSNQISMIGGYALELTIVNDDNGPVIKHRMFSFGLSYLFNR
jgi:hypothetical protein